ncbi:hypothetical protein CRUP_014293 [Coryphaenoides rupestris]|nr:hypothetical protein CRUP_014293 [Coryphaenoides rupestris]
MTEGGESAAAAAATTTKAPKELLALNPKEDSEFRKKVQSVKRKPRKVGNLSPGVVYVAHLPTSLGEKELMIYFQQFGNILRLRLARSKKTGNSKGYAFMEFECDEVAKIVAETMNNYLMRERLIKCQLMPPEKVHQNLFSGSRRKFKEPSFPAVKRYNRVHTEDCTAMMTSKLLSKEAKLRKRLVAKGIDYDFPGYDEEDDEVIVKLPPGLGDGSDVEEDGSDDEEDGSEEEVVVIEEPSEGEKAE